MLSQVGDKGPRRCDVEEWIEPGCREARHRDARYGVRAFLQDSRGSGSRVHG